MKPVKRGLVLTLLACLCLLAVGCVSQHSKLAGDEKQIVIPGLLPKGAKPDSIRVTVSTNGVLNVFLFGTVQPNWRAMALVNRIGTLYIGAADIRNLQGLSRFKIETMYLSHCRFADVRTLMWVKPRSLVLDHVEFSRETLTLDPSVKHLELYGIPLTDRSWLSGLQLVEFSSEVEVVRRGEDVLRRMESLRNINGHEIETFWEDFDAARAQGSDIKR